jgi:hypothetical protein
MKNRLLAALIMLLLTFGMAGSANAIPTDEIDGLSIQFSGIVDFGWVWVASEDPYVNPPIQQNLAGHEFSGSISVSGVNSEAVSGDWEFFVSGFYLVDPDPRINFSSHQDITPEGYYLYFLDMGQSAFVGSFNYFDGSEYVTSLFGGGDNGYRAPGSWYIKSDHFTWELASNGAPVPEPATMLLFGTGLATLFGTAWRKNKRTS